MYAEPNDAGACHRWTMDSSVGVPDGARTMGPRLRGGRDVDGMRPPGLPRARQTLRRWNPFAQNGDDPISLGANIDVQQKIGIRVSFKAPSLMAT